ncbi:hypothetical protein [Aneurinibacillus soli]|uniref:hypothetical protein n=1 Tax=Aneurinibacillus soli TaxID=1500254 RepID=UPI001E520263|nr:hypothetical protein [Aneurinibacillus soli]
MAGSGEERSSSLDYALQGSMTGRSRRQADVPAKGANDGLLRCLRAKARLPTSFRWVGA